MNGSDSSAVDRRPSRAVQRTVTSTCSRMRSAHRTASSKSSKHDSTRPAAAARVADRDAPLERAPHLGVVAADRHAVHRRAAAPIAAERDRHVAAAPLVRRRRVMRVLEVEAGVVQEPQAASVGVDAVEDPIDQRLVADEAVAAPRDERQRRDPVPQRQEMLVRARLSLARVDDTTHAASACSWLQRSCSPITGLTWPSVYVRVTPTRQPARPPHQVRHVQLRRQPEPVAGEVRVLRRGHDLAAAAGSDADALGPALTRTSSRDARRPEVAAAVAGQHLVALATASIGFAVPSAIVTGVPSTRH